MSSEVILLTVAEVQEATRLGRTKVYELIREGKLPVIRIGRSVRIRRDSLDQWLADLEEATKAKLALPW